MTRTLQVIEARVNEAFDHLTAALETLDERDRYVHIMRAFNCFRLCCMALSAEVSRCGREERQA